MNKISLDNGNNYLIVIECEIEKKKYLYLINEFDDSDIQIAEYIDDSTLNFVSDSQLLKNIVDNISTFIYKFLD